MDGDGVWSRNMRLGEKRENEKDRTKLYKMDARNGREDAGVFSERRTTEGKSLQGKCTK